MSEAKEGQVQEVVSEDQEELVVDAGVVDETLIEDTVLTPQRLTTLSLTLSIVEQVQKPIQKLIYWDWMLKRMKKKKKTITTM